MRGSSLGWRSIRSAQRLEGDATAPLPQLAPAAGGADTLLAYSGKLTFRDLKRETKALLRGAEWTPVFAAFMVYTYVITTYRFPVATVAMAAALAGLLFIRGGFRFPLHLTWFGLFIAWCAIGYLQTRHPEAAWQELVTVTKLWLITFAAANALRTWGQVRLFMIFYLGCYAFYPVRGALFNYYLYGEKLFGRAKWNHIYENPNDLAAITLLLLSVAMAVVAWEPRSWVRRAGALGLGLLPLLILLTQSRGAILGLAVMLGVILFRYQGQLRQAIPRKYRARVAVLAAAMAVVVLITAPSSVWDRVKGMQHLFSAETVKQADPEGSAEQRFEIWKVAAMVARDHPVFGVGIGAYPYEHAHYARTSGTIAPTARGQRDAHSTFWKVLAENGVIGLVLFSGMVIAVVVVANRTRRLIREVLPKRAMQIMFLELGLLGYYVAGIFGSFVYVVFPYLHLTLIMALVMLARKELAALAPGGPRLVAMRG